MYTLLNNHVFISIASAILKEIIYSNLDLHSWNIRFSNRVDQGGQFSFQVEIQTLVLVKLLARCVYIEFRENKNLRF